MMMSSDEEDEAVRKKTEEIRRKMKGVKRIVVKMTYNLETGELTVEHSPKKRYDADMILGLLQVASIWLTKAFAEKGEIKFPAKKKQEPFYVS